MNFLDGNIDVSIEVKLDGRIGEAFLAGGGDFMNPLYAHDGVFNDIGNGGFHGFRGGTDPGDGDVHNGKIHVWELTHSESKVADHAKNDETDHEHPSKYGFFNG